MPAWMSMYVPLQVVALALGISNTGGLVREDTEFVFLLEPGLNKTSCIREKRSLSILAVLW